MGELSDITKTLANVIYIVGVLLVIGMMVQRLQTMGHTMNKLEKRLEDHLSDRSLHPDAGIVDRRLDRLETRNRGGTR